MNDEIKNISIEVDAETQRLLQDASLLSGMSLEQFCLEAVKAKADLTVLLSGKEFPVEGGSAQKAKDCWLPIFETWEPANDPDDPTRKMRFVWEVNGEGMVRWGVKSTQEESVKDLEKLFAECDEITQGRVSSTDSADLIREAREERHRDMEGHGNS